MSSTSSLLTLPSVDEPLELTKTAPILDPKIPFFKYLDMLTTISQNALSLRQQAYEIFLALNPHFSYASSSASNHNLRQHPVKVNKKIETLLKSSMVLLQRYCLVIQVSLPKLPSFRRRTHGNSLKAYEVRAAGYLEDLKQYQEEGGLLYLQACFVRSKAAERDISMSVVPLSQGQVGAGAGGGDDASVVPSVDIQMVAKAALANFAPAAKSTDKEVPEPFNNSATTATATPPIVVVVEKPSESKGHLSVPVVVAEKPHRAKDQLNVPVVVVIEKPSKTREQPSVPVIVAESTSPSRSPSRRSSRSKKPTPGAQLKGVLEVISPPADTEAIAPPDAVASETSTPSGLVLTSAALWKLERDLERLQKAEVAMKEQIVQSAHIRARASESTAVPSTTTATPVRLTAAALAQLSTAALPTATSVPLCSYLPASVLQSSTTVPRPSAAAPSTATSTPVHSTPATVYTCSSVVVIPAGKATMGQLKRSKVSTVVTPAVTLTVPTPPMGTSSIPSKPLTTRGTLSYSSPKETAKSTNKRMSPATGAIKGSGVVRNLIRQYEIPSSASSTSSQSDHSDLKLNRKKKPSTTAAAAEIALTTPVGSEVKIAKPGQTITNTSFTTTTFTTPATATAASRTTTTIGAGVGTGLISQPRKDALLDLGDKQNTALGSASSLKTHPVQNTPPNNRDSARSNNNKNGFTHPVVPPVVSTSTSNASYPLSKARSAFAKSTLILETHQTTHTQGQSHDQPSKPRTAAEVVKDSYLLRSQTKADVEKQSSLQVPVQGYQSRTRPILNGKDFWNKQPPPPSLSQTRKISDSLINAVPLTTSVATVFRGGAESKPVVALGDPTFAPSNPPLEVRPAVAVVSEVNLSNQSSPISTSSKAMSAQESIDSWRRDVPTAASASRHPHVAMQDERISASVGPITSQPPVDWLNEADYEDNDEEDDGQSHVDLIRIPTMSSARSSATATTTRTASFSASHPLGSDRFKPRHRSRLSNALNQEEKQKETQEVQKRKEDGKEVKKKTSGYIPDTDESDTDTANLQILEVPPTRGTQAWLEMRTRELEQEREEEARPRLGEDSGDDSGPENGYDASFQLEQQHRYDSKYSTTRVDGTNRQRQTVNFSRPRLSQVRFDVHGSSQPSSQGQRGMRERKQELDEISINSSAPSFTRPFKPEYHPPIQHSSFNNTHQAVSQQGSRPTRQYASTISSTSTRSIRQPSLTHSVSPASSAFASLRGTPAPSTKAPSIKSFATGSTTALNPPKFYHTTAAAPRSYYPIQGQTDDGTTDTLSSARVRNIRAREARVLGSPAVPIPGSQPRQMNVQSAATLVRNRSYYGQQQ
ncbi:hypothetical protein BGZ47_001815 [Haplosporangium gracile]|nr:hypothetical protein BGZ47_001815 [Haplosporangium gracile]